MKGLFNSYDCRFCREEMKQIKEPIIRKREDVVIGKTLIHICNKCGVILIEHILDYTPEQIKEMFE